MADVWGVMPLMSKLLLGLASLSFLVAVGFLIGAIL